MVQETISRIESQLRADEGLAEEKREELLSLVGELKNEMAVLAETHRDDARSIASFTETTVHEATRKERNAELLTHSLDGMALSVRRFEVSHPRLTGLVNALGQTLWKIGI
jgi:hypothetical protein